MDTIMEKEMSFEQLLRDFEPMIHHLLHKYGIVDAEKEFYQEGSIALWRAWQTYDQEKGKFSTYAYFSIQKAFFTLMRKEKNVQKRKEKYATYTDGDSLVCYNQLPFDPYLLAAIEKKLSANQMKWFTGYILHQQTNKQIARQENVTENAVKNWARLAKPKIKQILGQRV
ncbi:RNA polymerase factor sigma-70 [Paraliobacillus sp. PM-2]|uniref:sigma-70 family RNA polymerase sigma factor n=1 Tax=Paraliobacillus sp. PM-2 TaxID=1462524 RepID=UPI00061C8CF7|nr:sigma-70 family RNA polymerase sigma factor [Paraliobacillus sp. PM-2]CQR46252.1 RNA polymerase factor sigma-70 [Paraliobacillus sp. PM-2]